jgi:hypothetical protein
MMMGIDKVDVFVFDDGFDRNNASSFHCLLRNGFHNVVFYECTLFGQAKCSDEVLVMGKKFGSLLL